MNEPTFSHVSNPTDYMDIAVKKLNVRCGIWATLVQVIAVRPFSWPAFFHPRSTILEEKSRIKC